MTFDDFKKAMKQKFKNDGFVVDYKYTSGSEVNKKSEKWNECGFDFESDVNAVRRLNI